MLSRYSCDILRLFIMQLRNLELSSTCVTVEARVPRHNMLGTWFFDPSNEYFKDSGRNRARAAYLKRYRAKQFNIC